MGEVISNMLADNQIASLGPDDAVEEAKGYYGEIGDNAYSIIKEALEQNEDIKDQLRS